MNINTTVDLHLYQKLFFLPGSHTEMDTCWTCLWSKNNNVGVKQQPRDRSVTSVLSRVDLIHF